MHLDFAEFKLTNQIAQNVESKSRTLNFRSHNSVPTIGQTLAKHQSFQLASEVSTNKIPPPPPLVVPSYQAEQFQQLTASMSVRFPCKFNNF